MEGSNKSAAQHKFEDCIKNHNHVKAESVPIPGNIYKYFTMMQFKKKQLDISTPNIGCMLGSIAIILIQVITPIAVFTAHYECEDWTEAKFGFSDYEDAADVGKWDPFFKKVLGVLFLFCFALNGANNLSSEQSDNRRLRRLIMMIQSHPEWHQGVSSFWLWAGAIINCWVVVGLTSSMFFFFVNAGASTDIIFDALGATFVYNLDDVGGEFGFVDDKWDGAAFGDIYAALKTEMVENEKTTTVFTKNIQYVYWAASIVQCALTMGLPVAYMFVANVEVTC